VPVGVETGPARAAGELAELAHGERTHLGAVELGERRHQHGADGDVHAHAERVGTADDRQQAGTGEPLDEAAVAGKHARVMHAHPVAQQSVECLAEPLPHPLGAQRFGDRLALSPSGDRQAHQPLGPLDGGGLRGVHQVHRGEAVGDGVEHAVGHVGHPPLVVQRGGALHRGDVGDTATRALFEIGGDGGHVAQRRRGQQHLAPGELQQRHLPRPATVALCVVVELVEAGEPELTRRPDGQRVVRQHLGGAHQYRRIRVDRCVAGGEAHGVGTQQVDEVEELLGHQRLDGGGPHGAATGVQRQRDTGHRHQALARTGGSGQHHVVAHRQGQDRVLLVRVQRAGGGLGPCAEGVDHLTRVGARCGKEVAQRSHHPSVPRETAQPTPQPTPLPPAGPLPTRVLHDRPSRTWMAEWNLSPRLPNNPRVPHSDSGVHQRLGRLGGQGGQGAREASRASRARSKRSAALPQ
jgi:hypothetical protein